MILTFARCTTPHMFLLKTRTPAAAGHPESGRPARSHNRKGLRTREGVIN